jgi:hypothetical protein
MAEVHVRQEKPGRGGSAINDHGPQIYQTQVVKRHEN